MKTLVPRLCAVTILAVAAAGCSVGYIYERYGASGAAIVTVGCHTSYEVWESYRDRTLLVRTNVQAGIAGAVCTDDVPPGAPPQSRLQRAAEEYFIITKRPKCRITEARPLSPIHSEFAYACAP
jgi:hypothetical protein